MKPLADEDLKPLIEMVLQDTGIDLSEYKDKFLRRRIGVRLRATGAENLHHYLRLMRQDAAEYRAFVDNVTINISTFFRNPGCFEIIDAEILPTLERRLHRTAACGPCILSIGCARGEEAYSLAMLVVRRAGLAPEGGQPPILGLDIDRESLVAARLGTYGAREVDGLPPALRQDFIHEEQGRYRVDARVRRLVAFERLDILRDELPGAFHLILCRNLLIYLEKEAQEKLMLKLAAGLVPGGWLVLGKSEILVGEARGLFEAVSQTERIYRLK